MGKKGRRGADFSTNRKSDNEALDLVKFNKGSVVRTNYKCYEGDLLDDLLTNLRWGIESARVTEGKQLLEKIWIKQQFAIGINDVIRVLERMPANEKTDHLIEDSTKSLHRRAPLVPLQVVLVASDCNPRSLTKHIPILASSRNVPLIFVKDNKGSSLRLGELVKLKTAMAIGVKARGSNINTIVDELC